MLNHTMTRLERDKMPLERDPIDTGAMDNNIDDSVDEADKGEARMDENGESSSTGSSEGKSGNGGGYSADCSDQSSDDTGSRKDDITQLAVGSLSLEDSRGQKGSSNDKQRKQREADRAAFEETDIDDGTATHYAPRQKENPSEKRIRKRHERKSAAVAPEAAARGDVEGGAVVKSRKTRRSRQSAELEAMQRYKEDLERETAAIRALRGFLPQFGGVRISHPMDPRIDLSAVGVKTPPTALPENVAERKMDDRESTTDSTPLPSMESYTKLMEVVMPFFRSNGVPYQEQVPKAGSGSDGTQGAASSSEGFTSFFTTTHSSANNSGSPNSSDMDKKPKAERAKPKRDGKTEDDESETSSMIVLARVKRKYKRAEEETSSSSATPERRVRIQEAERRDRQPGGNGPAAPADENVGSSMSSSSSEQQNQVQGGEPQHFQVPPRIVTDVSSSNRTDGTSSNTNSGSGSGSAGNTGSGSNQGSSGSGNDVSGSGNDGKGSSEDAGKDNSGEGTADGSDGTDSKQRTAQRHDRAGGAEVAKDPSSQEPVVHESEDAVRERKILDKKRKRIEMRREYEAQQQSESSENTRPNEALLRPGKPVSIDQVLQFSNIPRIVMQAEPPFLVVHTNAAYCRLTGMDSHTVVGKPIASLLLIPDGSNTASQSISEGRQDADSPTESNENTRELAVAAAAGRARASIQNRSAVGLERLIASSGFGRLHVIQVCAKPHQLVGKNVTVVQNAIARSGQHDARNRDERSNDTSISSCVDISSRTMICRSSIAPVVSQPISSDTTVVTDKDVPIHPKVKRRRLHGIPAADTHRKHSPPLREMGADRTVSLRQTVTHYVIQLQPLDVQSGKRASEESLSSNSTSVEARLLGLTKDELKGQKRSIAGALAHGESESRMETEGFGSESTETKEPVSAIA